MEEALDKVTVTLNIFKIFREAFREHKQKMPQYCAAAMKIDPKKQKPKLWDFQDSIIFERFDSFVARLHTVKEFFKTAQQFLKLEKVEIGGIRGRALSGRVSGVHEEFKVMIAHHYHKESKISAIAKAKIF